MPDPDNMLGMFTNPSPADGRQPRNGPPIQEWEAVPIGKNLVKGDAEDDENVSLLLHRSTGAKIVHLLNRKSTHRSQRKQTFKKSDLPANTRYLPHAMNFRAVIERWAILDGISAGLRCMTKGT
jgi:hypothetical protein